MCDFEAHKVRANVYKFGDEASSDVVIITGDSEFHAHKMLLAARSAYFSSVFCSERLPNFKSKEVVQLNEEINGAAFMQLLEMLYNSKIDGGFHPCKATWFMQLEETGKFGGMIKRNDAKNMVRALWSDAMCLVDLLNKVELYDVVIPIFDSIVLAGWCRKDDCVACANRLLLGLHFNLNLTKSISMKPASMTYCLKTFNAYMPDPLKIHQEDLSNLPELFAK